MLVQGSLQARELGMRDDLSTNAGLDLNPSLTLQLGSAGHGWKGLGALAFPQFLRALG